MKKHLHAHFIRKDFGRPKFYRRIKIDYKDQNISFSIQYAFDLLEETD